MRDRTGEEWAAAMGAIASMIDRSKKAQQNCSPGTAQHTLQKNRIHALMVASSLIERELTGRAEVAFGKDDLERAVAPLASLMSKSEKARQKLAPDTWQHAMLSDNLKALSNAAPLLEKALRGCE